MIIRLFKFRFKLSPTVKHYILCVIVGLILLAVLFWVGNIFYVNSPNYAQLRRVLLVYAVLSLLSLLPVIVTMYFAYRAQIVKTDYMVLTKVNALELAIARRLDGLEERQTTAEKESKIAWSTLVDEMRALQRTVTSLQTEVIDVAEQRVVKNVVRKMQDQEDKLKDGTSISEN